MRLNLLDSSRMRTWEGFHLLHTLWWFCNPVYDIQVLLQFGHLKDASGGSPLLLLPYIPFAFCISFLWFQFIPTHTFYHIPILISGGYCSLLHLVTKFDGLFLPKNYLFKSSLCLFLDALRLNFLNESLLRGTIFHRHGFCILTMWPV